MVMTDQITDPLPGMEPPEQRERGLVASVCSRFVLINAKLSHTMTAPSRPSITLPQGQVRGIRIDQQFPQPIDAFLGVPYALCPTGDSRFRPPVKVPD